LSCSLGGSSLVVRLSPENRKGIGLRRAQQACRASKTQIIEMGVAKRHFVLTVMRRWRWRIPNLTGKVRLTDTLSKTRNLFTQSVIRRGRRQSDIRSSSFKSSRRTRVEQEPGLGTGRPTRLRTMDMLPITDEQAKFGQELVKAAREIRELSCGRFRRAA
jgi:hypothetical protein